MKRQELCELRTRYNKFISTIGNKCDYQYELFIEYIIKNIPNILDRMEKDQI